MNRRILSVLAVLIAGAPSAWSSVQANKDEKKDQATTAQSSPASSGNASMPAPATADPNYLIGPQDVLDVNVWKEPDVSRSVPVRPDGKISLPLINDIQAAGLTPQQLALDVTDKLRKFVTEPQVTVIVTAINSQRVYVVGEVTRAGAFPLIPGMTALQALSSAGGFTAFANVKKIHVMRVVSGKRQDIPFNYREVMKGSNTSQDIKLEPGDTIIVP